MRGCRRVRPGCGGGCSSRTTGTLLGLLAVCVARVADASRGDWTTTWGAGGIACRVAQAAGLDRRQHWTATVESYFGRVPKVGILAAVREGAGPEAAHRLHDAKKDATATGVAELLHGTGWLPARLRTPALPAVADATAYDAASNDEGVTALPLAAE